MPETALGLTGLGFGFGLAFAFFAILSLIILVADLTPVALFGAYFFVAMLFTLPFLNTFFNWSAHDVTTYAKL